jgi:V/A-type H+-transporting ATPase subunit G/H
MALDVINDIKAAESKAQEMRRTAAAAAKDDIKLAIEENSKIREKEIESIRQKADTTVEAAGREAKAELERLSAQQSKECDKLKATAEKNLSAAADICLERILG